VLGAAIGVLAGCGSESPRTAASAINLQAGDAPGFVASSLPGRRVTYGPIGRCDGGLASSHGLPGYPSLRLSYTYGKAPSQARTPELNQFLGGSQGKLTTAHSVVYVFDSRSAALRELGALGSAHAQACILRQIPAARREGDIAVGIAGHPNEDHPPSIAVEKDVRVFPNSTGLDGKAVGLRETSRNSPLPGHPSRVYEESLGFVVGRTLVILETLAIPQPFPRTPQEHLLARLHRRAEEHAL
jgi:hypothetical protein